MKNQPFSVRRLLVPATILAALAAASVLVTSALLSGEGAPRGAAAPRHDADRVPASLAPVGLQSQRRPKSKTQATGQFIGPQVRVGQKVTLNLASRFE